QRITTALKNICRDYPPGGGILRELLQNADDAGATEVVSGSSLARGLRGYHANTHQKYVLDKKMYAKEELLDKDLAKYQGPAVLAFNNAIFTENDFRSLSSI